jgi:phospholipase D1/2
MAHQSGNEISEAGGMIAATAGVARTDSAASHTYAILQPGKNCWRVERATRFQCVQDGADYFRLVRQALLAARDTVFILGWDILSSVDLLPGATAADGPTRLDELLAFVAQRRPQVHCYILIWDHAALYTLQRDPLSRWRLGWRMPRQVRFGFDDHHPIGGSHHQKIVVVDDNLAFCGGLDLTGHRWDTSAHRVEEPERKNAVGTPYGPYHELQAMVSGPVAASIGVLARDRWRALGEERIPPVRESTGDLWPSDVTPDLEDVDVAIARTLPESETQSAVRECEALFLDSIAAAKQTIYVESQYFTNDILGTALVARLSEPNGPEVIVVTPKECEGWLERNTMGAFRDGIFRELIAADNHGRLRLVYPAASRAQGVSTFVHSKAMIVDDGLVRIGSANISRRSMGMDTECDLAVDAGDDSRAQAGIRRIRDRLLAEHLGLPVHDVARAIERQGSLRALVDSRQDAEHTLVRIELPADPVPTPPAALRATADPDEPMQFAVSAAELIPPVDARARRSSLRLWIPAIVLTAAIASTSSALVRRPELRAVQEALEAMPELPLTLWVGASVFLLANLALIPLELTAIVAGIVFGALRGGLVALLGSLSAAAIGYLVGRAIGPAGLTRWIGRRSYRSVRQLGARGVRGVIVLRLASIASAGSVHLLCGAGRVPFGIYMTGSAIGLIPVIVALSGMGGLLRRTLLHPSVSNGAIAIGAALLVIGVAVGLRTFLLIRQFAPSVSLQRDRAEFG